MRKLTLLNGVTFELCEDKLTAQIIYSPKAFGDVIIPQKIFDQNRQYTVTTISNGAFKSNKSIKSIRFTEDSELSSIETSSFRNSLIKIISLPSSVEILEEGWITETCELKRLNVSPRNPNFKYLNDYEQILLGKSDNSQENFDVLVYSNKEAIIKSIPPYVRRISQ